MVSVLRLQEPSLTACTARRDARATKLKTPYAREAAKVQKTDDGQAQEHAQNTPVPETDDEMGDAFSNSLDVHSNHTGQLPQGPAEGRTGELVSDDSEDDSDAMEDAVATPTVEEPHSKRQRIQLLDASLSNIQDQLLKSGGGKCKRENFRRMIESLDKSWVKTLDKVRYRVFCSGTEVLILHFIDV